MAPTPKIGQLVHVFTDPKTNNGADVAPATITRVFSDTCVNVRVTLDGYATPAEWRTSVSLAESREAAQAALDAQWASMPDQSQKPERPYGAFWPPAD